MALADKRRVVINRGRVRRRRNPRRKLTAKQIRFFGSPAQKAALKRNRHRKRNASKGSPFRRKARKMVARKRAHKSARRNPGEILSLALNPGSSKGPKMARRRRKLNRRRRVTAVRRHRRRSMNPVRHHAYRHRRRRTMNSRRRRRNPSGSRQSGITRNAIFLLAGAVGFFGSKVLTQAVMGSSNSGFVGYFGNAIATGALALVAAMLKMKNAAAAILAGGVLQIAARAVTDYTPFGQVTSSLGVGDYQVQNFVTPQRLVDPLNSAAIEIPSGWGGGAIPISTAAPPKALHPGAMAGYNRTGGGLYSGGGLYAS